MSGPSGRPGRLVVVGLGPGGADLLLPAARAALLATDPPRRFVRTLRHPAVTDLVAEGVDVRSCDDLYDAAADRDDIYAAIADRLTAAAEAGDVCFAVPGSPAVAEQSVALLRARLGDRLRLVPGLSFLDLAWLRLGVDPTAGSGARAVDGQALPAALPAGPLLVSHCHNKLVLSDVKLALLERLPAEAPVTVLARLGLPDESVTTLPLEDLDRSVEPDHLTSVFAEVPPGGPGEAWERFVALVERLRGPGGCPWDAEQTHHSLSRHLIEESYEVIEAIEALPASAPDPGSEPVAEGTYEHLEEELGDLAFQIVFHATLAREAGAFTITDVLTGVHDKLVSRHPHVFGDVTVSGADEVVANWEVIKRAEKGRTSLMDGVSKDLPSLLYAHKLYRKAASAGLTFGTAGAALGRAGNELAALAGLVGPDAVPAGEAEERLGEALAAVVYLARLAGVDGETALRGWAGRFKARFQALERRAAEQGVTVEALGPDAVVALWDQTA
ncbi:MAG TPA: nucleoside triphosphate pyrophosphohydrolase [Acidimicrobiia bacterium]|nr:nucleoside triphosphate pyrophosphohydrolase [Acidimicrobiia bacterium]